ncbi:zinc finger BED domain-containing protein 5-like [Styela clava]
MGKKPVDVNDDESPVSQKKYKPSQPQSMNFIKSKPLQSRLFEKLCEEMGSNHKTLLMHTEIRWLSRGKVLTRLGELREEVAVFLEGKCGNYECFETFQTFIIENEVEVYDSIISEISEHLKKLEESFELYFHEEMNALNQKRWVVNPFQPAMMTGISIKADEELIDLSEDSSSEMNFSSRKLVQFWVSLQTLYPLISTEALKALMPFSSSYKCESGFSAMIGIKSKFRNKLQLSNSLRLKLSEIEMNVKSIMENSKKQAHLFH